MSTLADYNPLARIEMPGAVLSNPAGIVVVIGPNSSGKTRFLRDIEKYLVSGVPGGYFVCRSIAVRKPASLDNLLSDLQTKNYLLPDGSGQYRLNIPLIRLCEAEGIEGIPPITYHDLTNACANFQLQPNGNNNQFFPAIGQAFVAPLSLESRLRIATRAENHDYETRASDNAVQELWHNEEGKIRLAAETAKVFGNTVFLEAVSNREFIQPRVSGGLELPSTFEMTTPRKVIKYRAIEQEGDGYRSYVGTCLALLFGIRPVALIDEPELCLHPPQAYHLGRFIGEFANEKHVTFVATHSSEILRGILDAGKSAGKRVTVVRLMHPKENEFIGHHIEDQQLLDTVRNPRSRAERILDGLFAKGVVIVESEGDREEYQAAAETIKDYPSREVHFAPMGGFGDFTDPFRLYRSLRVPVAIIADLDVLTQRGTVKKWLDHSGLQEFEAKELYDELNALVQKISDIPPAITPEKVKEELQAMIAETNSWSMDDDEKLRRNLGNLDERLKRIKSLKDGGVDAYRTDNPDIYAALNTILPKFERLGIFFVPVGELDCWVANLMTGVSRRKNKLERAAIAADRIRSATTKTGDIWDFVAKVYGYLQAVPTTT